MQFEHTWEKVLSSEKTQTRRLISSWGEPRLVVTADGEPAATDSPFWNEQNPLTGAIEVVTSGQGRVIYEVGKTYAVQPGRNQKAIGRILLTAIRVQKLQDISFDDARAEGAPPDHECDCYSPVMWYANLWDNIPSHKKAGTRWVDNPKVWVLEFELVALAG